MGPAIKDKTPRSTASRSDRPRARQNDGARQPKGRDDTGAPKRRDIASGESSEREDMVRFVIDPQGVVMPDLEGDLPGRGLWLRANRDVLDGGRLAPLFSRAAREKVTVPDDLADRLEVLLAMRCRNLLGLARRAGQVVAGYEQVRSALRGGHAAVLIAARDGAEDGRKKIRALAPDLPLIDALESGEIGAALGAGAMVHAAVAKGRLARELLATADKLGALRRR